MIAGLKDKGKFAYEGKFTFQTIATELYKQPPKAKKEHLKLVIVTIGVDVVAKIDDEGLCFSIIKTYCYFSCLLLCQKRSSC